MAPAEDETYIGVQADRRDSGQYLAVEPTPLGDADDEYMTVCRVCHSARCHRF